MFTSVCIHTDVLCVEVINNYIFAGIGGNLQIYQLATNTLIEKKQVFDGQNIIGIKPNSTNTKLVLYGGKHMALLGFQWHPERKIPISAANCRKSVLSDWILDAKWIDMDMKIATVSMHNKITIWDEEFHVENSMKCEETCILYSAHICHETFKELLVISGTVFSEILLWKPVFQNENGLAIVLKRLKQHKGVIFAIHYNPNNGLICSASDDRSAVLWRISKPNSFVHMTPESSSECDIEMQCQVYGHLSRVFCCLVLDNVFLTAGEDSFLALWNFQGTLLRKIDAHQGGSIWSLCYNIKMDSVCTGGCDGAILRFKINHTNSCSSNTLPQEETPKTIGILQTGNLVCLSKSAKLYYYCCSLDTWFAIANCLDLKKYCLMQLSACRQLVALAGFEGQIYIYLDKKGTIILAHEYQLENKSRIFAFHWLDCKTFLTSQKSSINLYFLNNGEIQFVQSFELPHLKEPWPTSACFYKDHIIIGDRKGHIHNFKVQSQALINSIGKAHNYLGVTSLGIRNGAVISLGRDGVVRKYLLDMQNDHLLCIEKKKTKFTWLAALEGDLLLSFMGDSFIASDLKCQRTLFEVPCGGGHRSWSYINNSETFQFSFVKQKTVYSMRTNKNELLPTSVIEGLHVREINCAKLLDVWDTVVMISGGEDTALRISLVSPTMRALKCLKVHLSSIRAMDVYFLNRTNNSQKYLLVTGGGRSQIICWKVTLYEQTVSCMEKFNFYQPLKHEEAETRIMDLLITDLNGALKVLAARSDGNVTMFQVSEDFKLIEEKSFRHSSYCVTKLAKITIRSMKFFISTGTDGQSKFWCLSQLNNPVELFSYQTHQSGITSVSCITDNCKLFVLSGGDDNCVSLTRLSVSDQGDVSSPESTKSCRLHCAQITGAYLVDKYFITSGIDQRVIVSKWTSVNGGIDFKTVQSYNTTISDSQGLAAFNRGNKLVVCIYGNGFEVLEIMF